MYLPSKFIKSKFTIPLLLLVILTAYFVSTVLFRNAFIYFYDNFTVSRSKLIKKINMLKAKNIGFLLERSQLKDQMQENDRLKKLLSFQREHKIKIVSLNVINMVPSHFRKAIIVKGGWDHNIAENTPILDENGLLIGKVSRVYYNYSEVTLMDDPAFYITVRINNNLGLLKGTLGGALKVFYVNNEAKVGNKDMVSALSYRTHSSFMVGEVDKAVKTNNSFFMDITVKPYSKFYPYKTVFAVR